MTLVPAATSAKRPPNADVQAQIPWRSDAIETKKTLINIGTIQGSQQTILIDLLRGYQRRDL